MISLTNEHRYQQYKNQILYWLDTDSEETFQNNMQDVEKRKRLEEYNWHLPKRITYQFNSHGFRADEFAGDAGFIALGCSFTVGVGLPVDQIWPSIVAQQLGLKAWILGIGGCSLDTCFRLLANYIDQLKPRFVLLLQPSLGRFEIHDHNGVKNILPNLPDNEYRELQKLWYLNEQNQIANFYKNIMSIKHLCHANNSKLVIKEVAGDLVRNILADRYPSARDLSHHGHASHVFCASRFLEHL